MIVVLASHNLYGLLSNVMDSLAVDDDPEIGIVTAGLALADTINQLLSTQPGRYYQVDDHTVNSIEEELDFLMTKLGLANDCGRVLRHFVSGDEFYIILEVHPC